jgi:hypothetical protein
MNKYTNLDPVLLAQLKAAYFENNGPLSHDFSPCGWSSGVTTNITVADAAAFRDFLDNQQVTYQELDGSFQLYRRSGKNWPGTSEDCILFKDELEIRVDDITGETIDPFVFWRAVSKFMEPDTFFRAIETGFVGYAPVVFGRETGYFTVAIAVSSNGTVIAQDFENYLVYPC